MHKVATATATATAAATATSWVGGCKTGTGGGLPPVGSCSSQPDTK